MINYKVQHCGFEHAIDMAWKYMEQFFHKFVLIEVVKKSGTKLFGSILKFVNSPEIQLHMK